MNSSFDNIDTVKLIEVIESPAFRQHWQITKDMVKVCKDCEFRHICTDCRAYIEDPDDVLSKPLKCGYDPYTNAWSDWNRLPI